MGRIRVYLVDDHAMVREGIANMLRQQGGFDIVGQAGDGERLLAEVAEAAPDVVLMDLALPGMDGVALCQRLAVTCPRARVLMLTMHDDADNVARAAQAGAAGYLLKTEAFTKTIEAIETLYRGRRYYPQSVQERLIDRTVNTLPEQERLAKLSDREFEFLRLVALGRTVKECAASMEVTVSTVSTYRARVLEKLDLNTTGEMIRFALENGVTG
jgi:DNA-binding NarL/FixJ family response regulator